MSTEFQPARWRFHKVSLGMKGSICPHCETPQFPPRDTCLNCTYTTKGKPTAPENSNGNGNGYKKEDPGKAKVIYRSSDSVKTGT